MRTGIDGPPRPVDDYLIEGRNLRAFSPNMAILALSVRPLRSVISLTPFGQGLRLCG
jgi:hypothetical protein